MKPKAYTVRWGDLKRRAVAIGESVDTLDLFRVNAAFPQVWRVMMHVFVANAANFGVSFLLRLNIGTGSNQVELDVPFPSNSFNSFELPALSVVGSIRSSPALAIDQWKLSAFIAPIVPTSGIEVDIAKG